MFTAALFTIGKKRKQPKCPLDDWINKMWYSHTTQYYLGIKSNAILIHAIL